jgi:periplasmic nitrate reductase NapD
LISIKVIRVMWIHTFTAKLKGGKRIIYPPHFMYFTVTGLKHPMNISGVVVHALPARLEQVRCTLEALPGLEIHAAADDGRLVVTLEDDDHLRMADTVLNLHRLEGVLAAAMVYQYSDENEEH